MAHDHWLTVADIAGRLGVGEQTVRRWLREGRLPGRDLGGRTGYRVRERDFDAFLSRAIDAEDAAGTEDQAGREDPEGGAAG